MHAQPSRYQNILIAVAYIYVRPATGSCDCKMLFNFYMHLLVSSPYRTIPVHLCAFVGTFTVQSCAV